MCVCVSGFTCLCMCVMFCVFQKGGCVLCCSGGVGGGGILYCCIRIVIYIKCVSFFIYLFVSLSRALLKNALSVVVKTLLGPL